MKKAIILALFTLIAVNTLWGQSGIEPSPTISAAFARQFPNATRVIWNKAGELTFAQFHADENTSLAYFDDDGKLVAKGRKISEDQLPAAVRANLLSLKSDREKKMGTLAIGNVFEYSEGSSKIQYVTSLESNRESIVVGTIAGKMTVRSRVKKDNIASGPSREVTAKVHP